MSRVTQIERRAPASPSRALSIRVAAGDGPPMDLARWATMLARVMMELDAEAPVSPADPRAEP